jgi:hypothetical protein
MLRIEEIAEGVATIVRFMVDEPDDVKIHIETVDQAPPCRCPLTQQTSAR